MHTLHNRRALDLDEARIPGKRDKVPMKRARIALGEVDGKRERDAARQRVPAPVHRAGAIEHDECILSMRIVGQCAPCDIKGTRLLLRDVRCHCCTERTDHIVRIERPRVQRLLAARDARKELRVPLRIVAQERRAVFEHRPRRLLCIRKRVVPRPQSVLDDGDAAAQTDEHPAVVRLPHPEQDREPPRLCARRAGRCVDGGQPLRKERDSRPLPRRIQVACELCANEADSNSLHGCIEEDEQIVPAAVLRHEVQILFEDGGRMGGEMDEQDAEEPPLAQSPAHVARIEEGAQGIEGMIRKGAREAHNDLCRTRRTQCACRREEVERL